MDDKTREEIFKRLDILAEKLGVAANHLWDVLIRQARIEFLTDVMFVAINAVLIWAWLRFAKKWDEDGDGVDAAIVVSGIVLAVFTIIVLFAGVAEMPTLLFNPEYWAIQKVMGK